jgi:hypothetical protein
VPALQEKNIRNTENKEGRKHLGFHDPIGAFRQKGEK